MTLTFAVDFILLIVIEFYDLGLRLTLNDRELLSQGCHERLILGGIQSKNFFPWNAMWECERSRFLLVYVIKLEVYLLISQIVRHKLLC